MEPTFYGRWLSSSSYSHKNKRERLHYNGFKNGRVYVKNRKGEDYNGFPINLDSEISNKLYFKKSSSSSKSIIQILSENGKLFEIVDGKILSSKDQYRNEKDSKFKMIHEASGKNPILVSYIVIVSLRMTIKLILKILMILPFNIIT